MKNLPRLFAFVLTVSFASIAAAQKLPAGHPSVNANGAGKMAPALQLTQKGTVVSTISAPPYVYIEVKQDNKTEWLAANALPLKKDDVIRFDNGMVMTNFHSRTLNRTFPRVLFVSQVVVTKE